MNALLTTVWLVGRILLHCSYGVTENCVLLEQFSQTAATSDGAFSASVQLGNSTDRSSPDTYAIESLLVNDLLRGGFVSGHPPIILGMGTYNYVVLAHHPEFGHSVIKMPTHNFARARIAYAHEASILKALTQGNPPEADLFLPFLSTRLDDLIPIIHLPKKEGSLAKHLGLLKNAPFAERARIMRTVTEGVAHHHSRGIAWNDIKPANILVDIEAEKLVRLQFGDMDFAAPFNTLPPHLNKLRSALYLIGTPLYMRPGTGFRSNGGQESNSTVKKDMYALMVTLQEIVTGIARSAENYRLQESLHSTDPSIPETLSTLTWIEFDYARQLLEAINLAIKYENDPDKFYARLSPLVLSGKSDWECANLIHGDKALLTRFERDNGASLGFANQEKIGRIKKHLGSLKKS